MGDMNARVGKLLNSTVVERSGKSVKNDNRKRLIEMCETLNSKINSTFSNIKIFILLRRDRIPNN